MEHEPRPATHMEKHLGWAHKLGGTEFLGISKVSQIVRLMESQIWHKLADSVGRELRKGIMTSVHLEARYFTSSLHTTGAFQAATPVLKLIVSESE